MWVNPRTLISRISTTNKRRQYAGQVTEILKRRARRVFKRSCRGKYLHAEVINSPVRDTSHVLDGLLNHESDLRIDARYADSAGFTDPVFARCHFLGLKFTPRVADLTNKKRYEQGR